MYDAAGDVLILNSDVGIIWSELSLNTCLVKIYSRIAIEYVRLYVLILRDIFYLTG